VTAVVKPGRKPKVDHNHAVEQVTQGSADEASTGSLSKAETELRAAAQEKKEDGSYGIRLVLSKLAAIEEKQIALVDHLSQDIMNRAVCNKAAGVLGQIKLLVEAIKIEAGIHE
jgi:hypothetical protein